MMEGQALEGKETLLEGGMMIEKNVNVPETIRETSIR